MTARVFAVCCVLALGGAAAQEYAPVSAPPVVGAAALAPARVGTAPGLTRVVVDLPEGASHAVVVSGSTLRIDIAGQGMPAAQPVPAATPQLAGLSWRWMDGGVSLVLASGVPLGPGRGWRASVLPPQDGVGGYRLQVELSAAFVQQGEGWLGVPRVGQEPGRTRVVLDLPRGVTPRVRFASGQLHVELPGARAQAQRGDDRTPELGWWSYAPVASGVTVTVTASAPLRPSFGWDTQLLEPVQPGGPRRLVIDLMPAEADTSALPPTAALTRFVLPTRIVLDPGHGGVDPGAQGLVSEEVVTLDVARRVRALLTAAGAEVVMSRDRDVELHPNKGTDLNMRAALGAPPAAALVSIHVNAMPRESAMRGFGLETWWYPNDAHSRELAQTLLSAMASVTSGATRGVKSDSLAVLRGARVPAALVEIGFAGHPVDGLNLRSDAYLQRVALGIARGIQSFVLARPALPAPAPVVDPAPVAPFSMPGTDR